MTKYKDILKVEFVDSLAHFDNGRDLFHIYRINRLLSNGSIISFDYYYLPSDDPNTVKVEINLREFGSLTFEINIKTSYGKVITKNKSEVIQNFVKNYDIFSEAPLKV